MKKPAKIEPKNDAEFSIAVDESMTLIAQTLAEKGVPVHIGCTAMILLARNSSQRDSTLRVALDAVLVKMFPNMKFSEATIN